MSMTVPVAPGCSEALESVTKRKEKAFVMFKLTADKSQIVVDCVGDQRGSFDDAVPTLREKFKELVSRLPKDECRYIVADVFYPIEGTIRNKVLFINWAPDHLGMKAKMVHGSAKGPFREWTDIALELQATELVEVDYDACVAKCGGKV